MKRVENITNVEIMQLKAPLRRVRPPVWRRLHIRNDATLEALHECLQVSFGWANSHLHSFSTGTTVYGPEALADALNAADERGTCLRDVFRRPGDRLWYEYDPGDGWAHDLVFERTVPFDYARPYPWVVGGRRACPPDDVGGVSGYERFLEAVTDKRHPEHKDMRKWYGGTFDPAQFDLLAVNRELHGEKAPAPEESTP